MRNRVPSRERAVLPSRLKDPLAEREEMERHQDVFCVVAGVPCQDVSVAGKRAGLKGERTGLFYEFARILQELRPAWFVFENVPGFLSSNKGRDFAEVLRVLMVECGYGVCWRVLDSQFFGVAQRRRRLFIVGSLGRPCPAEVLFESESGQGDSAESNEARPNVAAPLTSGSGVTGNAPGRRRGDDENLAYCLREDPGGIGQGHNTTYALHGRSSPRGDGCDNLIAAPLDCGLAKRRHDQDGYTQHLVAATIGANLGGGYKPEPGAGIIAIQDVRGLRDKKQNGIGIDIGGPSYTLDKTSQHAVAFAENQRGELRTSAIAPQLSTGGGKPGSGYSAVAYPFDQERSGIEFDTALEVDGANQRTGNDGAAPDSNGVRDFAGLPEGLDSARYRALGNAVTVQVAYWIARRILQVGTSQAK